MKKINLAITGCLGRMGQQLIKTSNGSKNFKLISITEYKLFNKKIFGLKPQLNSESAFKNANIIIDFTTPKCSLEVLKIALKLEKKVVIGTTGFSNKEEKLIKKYSKKIPILKAGNMSLGINLLMYITEITSKSLGENFLSKIFAAPTLSLPTKTGILLLALINNASSPTTRTLVDSKTSVIFLAVPP